MKDIRTFRKMIYQIYKVLNHKQKVQMLGVFILILIGALFELLGVSAILPLVQAITEPDKLYSRHYIRTLCNMFNINSPNGVVILVGVGIILIYILKNLYLSFSTYVQSRYNGQIKRDMAILMLRSYMHRPYSFFVETSMDTIMRGVQDDSGCFYTLIFSGLRLLSELLLIAVVTAYLMATDVTLTIGVLVMGIVCMLFILFGLKKVISRMSSLTRMAAGRQYKWIYQIAGGIKDIMVYNRQPFFIRSFESAAHDSGMSMANYNFVSTLPERVIEAFSVSGIIIAILTRVFMGVETVAFVSKLAVFAMGAFRILPSISRATGYLNNFVYYRQWVDSAYSNIMEARRITAEEKTYYWDLPPSEEDHISFNSNISVEDVYWKYPGASTNVLEGVSFSVEKGQIIGIIGESGSGKSTLSDILLGLYRPQYGDVKMDGVSISNIPFSWGKTVGYVPQSVFLLDDTVRENVVFGAEEPDDEKIWEALKKASLDEFIKSLPDGLDTLVGDRGIKFSGGQKQRVAIARALYSKPQILILDEATAALDNETEKAVMDEINLLAGTMTLIIIAHRLSTLKNCDRIYEIINGIAVERDKDSILEQS